MAPPSTAAEESRQLMRTFKVLSLPQCRVLVAVRDLVRPLWWEAINQARDVYGGGRRGRYRTVGVLKDLGLVEEIELQQIGGGYYGKLLELTKHGRMIEPLARRRLREEGMA
jgi:hypothetical protein